MKSKCAYILFYLTLLVLIVPNALLSITEKMCIWGRIANILFPLGVYMAALCLSKKIGRSVLCCIPLFVFCAFQLVLLKLYGNGVIAVDMLLNVVTTNSKEVGELLGSMLPIIIWMIILYGSAIGLAVYSIIKKLFLSDGFKGRNLKVSYVVATLGIISIGAAYGSNTGYSVFDDLFPANVGYNMYLACDRTAKTARQPFLSADFKYHAKSDREPNEREIYVLVVGETSRAANWQLSGYKRNTNPCLSRCEDLIYMDDAMSESNTTHKSVPMLLSPVTAGDFDREIYRTKSLVSAFKEAGFSTAFISNQMPNHSFIDYFANEADTTLFVRIDKSDLTRFDDGLLLPAFEEILAQGHEKQLIVLHSYGSHFNYRDRYDPDEAFFLPDDYENTDIDNLEQLVNAYDNTIRGTDAFLQKVIERIEIENVTAAMIYTSDHGEDIYDDGKSFLHASPTPSMMQLHVPMLVWLSKIFRDENPFVVENLFNNKSKPVSTSRSFCPTALDVAGIRSDKISRDDAISSEVYRPVDRVYLDDHNEVVNLKEVIK